jgi:hypothetical protein
MHAVMVMQATVIRPEDPVDERPCRPVCLSPRPNRSWAEAISIRAVSHTDSKNR